MPLTESQRDQVRARVHGSELGWLERCEFCREAVKLIQGELPELSQAEVIGLFTAWQHENAALLYREAVDRYVEQQERLRPALEAVQRAAEEQSKDFKPPWEG